MIQTVYSLEYKIGEKAKHIDDKHLCKPNYVSLRTLGSIALRVLSLDQLSIHEDQTIV